MRVLLDFQTSELGELHRERINDFISSNSKNEVLFVLDGEYEELCNEIHALYSKTVGYEMIKVWNWYPDCDNEDKNCFHDWFIGQIDATEIWACDSEGDIVKCENFPIVKEFKIVSGNKNKKYLRQVARSITDGKLFNEVHHIYIDLSDAVNTEFVTGIQRVCYALIKNIVDIFADDKRYEVCPIYSEPGNNLTVKCLNVNGRYRKQDEIDESNVVQFVDGDFLLMPDINILNVSTKVHYYNRLHNRGVRVYTLLHDIIPIRYPEYYSTDHVQVFTKYAEAISHFSGIIANSRATMEDYKAWISEQNIPIRDDFEMKYFHLGCDLNQANPTKIREDENLELLEIFEKKDTFLMVATIEPRKMHEQVLKAFEILWEQGKDINLVFVGKYGWQMEQLAAYINKHPYLEKNLFWLQGVSDEYLDRIYEASTAVIVASVVEGFGLPIIEAANHGKYLILRDIPVFREVAGDSGYYFDTMDYSELANSIEEWLQLYDEGNLCTSSGIECTSWKDATRTFIKNAGILV